MRITTTVLTMVLAAALACDSGDAGKGERKADEKAKAAAKVKDDAKAKAHAMPVTDAKAEAKADAKAEPPEADAKALETNAQDTNTPKNDTAGDVPPDSLAPTVRPKDVPEDWQRVAGDVWSFWVPKDWKITDVKPSDGGSGDKGDKQAEAQRSEGGMAISSLSCWVRSDQGLPTKMPDLKKKTLEQAKADAKTHEAKATDVKVEHDEGPQEAVQIEYAASGDGTRVIERWGISARALGLICSDESGKPNPADRKILDTAIGSLRWTVGD